MQEDVLALGREGAGLGSVARKGGDGAGAGGSHLDALALSHGAKAGRGLPRPLGRKRTGSPEAKQHGPAQPSPGPSVCPMSPFGP